MQHLLNFLVFCSTWSYLITVEGVSVGSNEPIVWTRDLPLDDRFTVRFNNEDPDKLIMEMFAPTKGYVAIGFSPNGAMRGSDIIMGWIDSEGQAHIKDMYAKGNEMPIEDDVSNVKLLWAEQNEYGTTIRFSRPWNTCDMTHDMEITEDTMRLIWATSPEDPFVSGKKFTPRYHGPDLRGVKSLFLKVPTHLQAFPDDDYNRDPSIKYWDVRLNKVTVPGDSDTTYFCKIVKSPHVYEAKHQIIGYRTLIEEANKQWVHHINFFECTVPPHHGTAESVFEKYLDHPGGHCYHKNMPPEWGQYCMTVPFVWVAGAEGLMLPKEGGIPLGERNNGTTYFMLEIHYDNPKMIEFEDSSGVRIFVTDTPRPNDFGAVTIHTRFSHGFHLIPPGTTGFKNMAMCTSECTQKAIPPEGITVTHATLHAHLTARKLKLRHIRNGVELPPIAQDDHYDFNYQQTRLVSPQRKIYPGDILIQECEFDTTDREKITYGGTSTRDEMCQGYIYFYPRIPLSLCKTQYEFYNFFDALGIKRVEGQETLDRVSLPYVPNRNQLYDPGDDAYILKNNSDGIPRYIFDLLEVAEPTKSGRKQTVSEYVENLPWKSDEHFTHNVWSKWWAGKHDTFCTGHSFKRIPLRDYSVNYPNFKPYLKPIAKKCLGHVHGSNNQGRSFSGAEATDARLTTITILTSLSVVYAGAKILL